MAKTIKTNAIRILERERIDFKAHTYDAVDGKIDGISAAEKIGFDPSDVYKTLVAQGVSREHYVFIIPVTDELDLKKAAAAAEEKKIEMIAHKQLLAVTGYVKGGCSPLGMKKPFRTFLDSSAELKNTIVVSAGKIGFQVELPPEALIGLTEGISAELTR